MARDSQRGKTFWDDDPEEVTKATPGKVTPGAPQRTGALTPGNPAGEVDTKLRETEILLDQIHRLYQQYFTGIEKRPPADRARLLETKVKELERLPATSTAAKFKLSQFLARYRQFRELWDRKLRDLEKI